MTIDLDVALAAKHWGLDPNLLQAVVRAEGDILKAVQCSLPTITTRRDALDVLCRSCAHALSDFVKANDARAFIAFWAHRWAPQGSANDPHNLNAYWPSNVLALWLGNQIPASDVGSDIPGGGAG